MVVTQANWSRIVQRDLNEVFLEQWRDFQSLLPLVFKYEEAEQGTEYDLEGGDVGSPAEFTGQITYDEVLQGFRKSFTETEYTLGLRIQRRLLRNDLYDVIRREVGLLAQAFRQNEEQIGASIFNNAFNTTHTVGDGLAMCSTAHTSNVGGSNQSNSGTSALSAANVETTRQNMIGFQTNRDNVRTARPDCLLVPTELNELGWEIVNSYGKHDTSVNNANFQYQRYDIIVWDNFLTDANNWFMIDKKLIKLYLKFFVWEPVQFFRSGEFDTITQKFAGYESIGVGTVEWRHIFGQNVA